MGSGRSDGGQASVELMGLLPLVAVVGVLLAQAALAGVSWWMVGTAAHAGARARALGADPAAAARAALPGGLREGLRVTGEGDGVRVSVRIPRLLPVGGLGRAHAQARMEPQT
jgi:hypothetical protein